MRFAMRKGPGCAALASLATGLLAVSLLASSAQAQSAEQHQRDMNDIAATPPQQDYPWTDDEPRAPDLPSRPSIAGFTTMTYHPDTASVWTTAGHKTLKAAKSQALAGCNAATGGGCVIVAAIEGTGRISVTEDAMGQLWVKGAVGNEMLAPVDLSMQHCLDNSFGCKFLGSHDSGTIYLDEDPDTDQSENYFPKGSLTWNLWAMVAQPQDAAGLIEPGKSWLISGKKGYTGARKQVLDRCKAESGLSCSITAYAAYSAEVLSNETGTANGLLVNFEDAAGRSRWTSAVADGPAKKKSKKGMPVDPVTVQDRVRSVCGSFAPCKVITTYDAATPRLEVITLSGSP
jgi:hypothetical protein